MDDCSIFVAECARRYGKTTNVLKLFLEHGLRHRRHQMRFATSTVQSCRDIVIPIFDELTADCPRELKPIWNGMDGCWIFPSTGTRLYLRGLDDPRQRERLRGTALHLGAIDEAGYCQKLDYVLRSILLPQTITTRGRIILISNAPLTPTHEFCAIADRAELDGFYCKFTIDENTSLAPSQLAQIERDCGGRESTTFRREYLCERVAEDDVVVLPEWRHVASGAVWDFDAKRAADPLDAYWHRYQSMDHGLGKDLTVPIFGFYHFREARLYIEHEDSIRGPKMTTAKVAELVRAVEKAHPEYAKPHRRIADNNNPLLLSDLGSTYGLHFVPVGEGTGLAGRPKENLDAMVNELRLFIAAGRLVVHPRCKMLIQCLKGALWEEQKGTRRQWAHHRELGHYDALAALMYLVRAIDVHTNPVPPRLGLDFNTHHINERAVPAEHTRAAERAVRQLFHVEGD